MPPSHLGSRCAMGLIWAHQRQALPLLHAHHSIPHGPYLGASEALLRRPGAAGDGGVGEEEEEVSAPDVDALTHIENSVFTLPVCDAPKDLR